MPDMHNPAMQGHDMSTMPSDEAMQARDHEASNVTENQVPESSDQQPSTVQDESKPHTHKHTK